MAGLFLVPLAGAGLILGLVLRISRMRSGAVRPATPRDGPPADIDPKAGKTPPAASPSERRVAARTAVMVAVSGFCLPWLVGLAVRFYLDATGEPTFPVSGFLAPESIVILSMATVLQWCWPFLLLAFWIRSRRFPGFVPGRSFAERLLVARLAHAVGLAGAVFVFIPVFRRWDTMFVFVPLGLFVLMPILGGYFIGLLVLRLRRSSPGCGE